MINKAETAWSLERLEAGIEKVVSTLSADPAALEFWKTLDESSDEAITEWMQDNPADAVRYLQFASMLTGMMVSVSHMRKQLSE